MRQCRKCLQSFDESFFYDRVCKKTGKKRLQYSCKTCEYKRVLAWRAKNPEANKKIYTRGRYKSSYGLTLEEVKTKGTCPICWREDRKLVVDHCHSSGLFRDFLCTSCNTLLGSIENDEKMRSVLTYLDKHRSSSFLVKEF